MPKHGKDPGARPSPAPAAAPLCGAVLGLEAPLLLLAASALPAFEHGDSGTAANLLFYLQSRQRNKGRETGNKSSKQCTAAVLYISHGDRNKSQPACSVATSGEREGSGEVVLLWFFFLMEHLLYLLLACPLSAQPEPQPRAGTTKGPTSRVAMACGASV